jgi:regulator of sigma E protease
MDVFNNFLQFFGVLIVLIIIHELGHFLVARLLKVEVEEFGIFFPPKLATLFEWGGTKFTLNAIPLGGFVRPKGENDPTVEGGLAAANPWVRLAVLVAGPLANLLTAVLLYAVIFTQIEAAPDYSKVLVAGVVENSPAEGAGLMTNDRLVRVGASDVTGTTSVQEAIGASLNTPLQIMYERDGQIYETTVVPRSDQSDGRGAIGIYMTHPLYRLSFLQAIPAGFEATYRYSRAILELPVQIMRGNVTAEEARPVGFKGMFDIYQEVREGELAPEMPVFVGVLLFVTMISISLGLLNLIPFPALDGGRILFTLPEIILRRRVPPEYENVIHLVGFAILLILLIYVNLQDFINPVIIGR